MHKLIAESRSIRVALLKALYLALHADPGQGWVWRRELERQAGSAIDFELNYLSERHYLQADGPKYRISATGIDFIEQEND